MMDLKLREITEWITIAEKQIEESNFDDLIAPSDSLSAQYLFFLRFIYPSF